MKNNIRDKIKGLSSVIGVVLLLSIVFSCDMGQFEKENTVEGSNSSAVFHDNVQLDVKGTLSGESLSISEGDANQGDIVIINQNSIPMAKRIVSKNDNIAIVEDADVAEVFSELAIDETRSLMDLNQSQDRALARSFSGVDYSFPDIKVVTKNNGIAFVIDRYKLFNNHGILVDTGGEIWLEKPTVNVKYSIFTKKATLSINMGERSSMYLNASTGTGSKYIIDKDIFLASYNLPITVSGVPVANVIFILHLNVGATGELNIRIDFSQQLEAEFGVISSLKSYEFFNDFHPPKGEDYYNYSIKGRGTIEAWAILQPSAHLSILQYSVASIMTEFGTTAKINGIAEYSDGSGTASVTLGCDIFANAKARFYVPSKKDITIFDWKKEFEYKTFTTF